MNDFEMFVAARGPALLRLGVMLTGTPHESEDLVQSALVKVCKHWNRVAVADNPEAYVRQIMVREQISWKRRKASTEVISASPHELQEASSRLENPDHADSVVTRDHLWQLLATLPRKQRAVLVLRYYEDMSDAQIADVLNCRQGTVRSNAHRALRELKLTHNLSEELMT